jgi:hypothetical protein
MFWPFFCADVSLWRMVLIFFFSAVQPLEIGLDTNTFTKSVNVDKVYTGGR